MSSKTKQNKIGIRIKEIRERQKITQQKLAKALKTSQSAIARIEKGQQNLTTTQIEKIERVLGEKILSMAGRDYDLEIMGGGKLSGEITTNTSKNGAVALLCASLINKGKTTLSGIPRIEEINRLVEILESVGVRVSWIDEHSLTIKSPEEIDLEALMHESVGKIRSSLMLIGSLVHHHLKFRLPHAGGCKMGERTISAHRYALEDLGVRIKTREDCYEINCLKNLKPADITLYESSDTATINALLAAASVEEETIIRFATSNYQVQDVCYFLKELGIEIEGIGTSILKVTGKKNIEADIEYANTEDPIESMMFISAALTTGSNLKIKRCPIDFLRLELKKLEKMGLVYKMSKTYKADNGESDLVDITIKQSDLRALPDKIHAQPYPGINTDNLPFFVPIATQTEGTTKILDWMWENRAIYFTELNRLGAGITLADPHRVFIEGPTALRGAQIVCPPALRPSVIILIAMLASDGLSILRNVYSINRGYENIVERLNSIGADIRILSS